MRETLHGTEQDSQHRALLFALRRTTLSKTVVLVGATLLAACGSPSTNGGSNGTPQTHAITGYVRVYQLMDDPKFSQCDVNGVVNSSCLAQLNLDGDSCDATGGYSDLSSGSQVVVKDGSGNVIATGSEASGTIGGSKPTYYCELPITVSGVPDKAFYAIQLGHRNAMTYSKAQMVSQNWAVSIEVGK